MQHTSHGQQGQEESQRLFPRPVMEQMTPPQVPVPLQSTPPTLQARRVGARAMFGITTIAPPMTDGRIILPRADDVSTILRMLGDAQISTVVLTGEAGAGKSTLAALAFRQLQAAAQAGASPFHHFIWLGLSTNSSVPDCLAALLSSICPDFPTASPTNSSTNALPPDFMHMKPDQQLAYTLQVLRQPPASALVVIDQFEELLDIETGQGLPGRGATALFFEMLRQDMGTSRVLLTCSRSPFGTQNEEQSRGRAYMISRVVMPEGMALLQQRGVVGSTQELSLVWQRCAGNVYGLTLFAALFSLSGFSLSYLLNATDHQYVWDGDVPLNLAGMAYNFLNPIQRILLHALCLFKEPVPLAGILAALAGEGQPIDTMVFERELAALTRLALVQYIPGDYGKSAEDDASQPRYFLHAHIRKYTIEHFLEGTDRRFSGSLFSVGVADEPNPMMANPEAREIALAAGHMRVATYYARQSQGRCPSQEERGGPLDITALLAVMEHLCLGWHWQQAYDLLIEENLHERLVQWGAWNTLIRLYSDMIPPTGIVTRSDEAFICGHLGLLYGRLDDLQMAEFYFQQALSTQREMHDTRSEATTLTNQGELLRSAGHTSAARAAFEQAWQLIQSLKAQAGTQAPRQTASPQDIRLESALLHNMGLLAQQEKDYSQALQYYLGALDLATGLPDSYKPYNLGTILTNTGMLFFEQGRLPEALSLLLQSQHVRQAAHDPTVGSLVLFLQALEQRLGPAAYERLRREAQRLQA